MSEKQNRQRRTNRLLKIFELVVIDLDVMGDIATYATVASEMEKAIRGGDEDEMIWEIGKRPLTDSRMRSLRKRTTMPNCVVDLIAWRPGRPKTGAATGRLVSAVLHSELVLQANAKTLIAPQKGLARASTDLSLLCLDKYKELTPRIVQNQSEYRMYTNQLDIEILDMLDEVLKENHLQKEEIYALHVANRRLTRRIG